jgi:hypothetical protein
MVEKMPLKETEEETPERFGIGESEDEEPEPVFDSNIYEPPVIEQKRYIIPDLEEEPVQTSHEETFIQPDEVTIQKEKTVEAPPVVVKKMDVLIDTVSEMLSNLKEMNNLFRETIIDQRKINAQLRDMNKNFDRLKMKKRWFRFL